MTIPTSALEYELDPRRIATRPAEPRDSARMMVVHRREDRVEHRIVRDLPEYLRDGDRLVLNRTRVMPARLCLRRTRDGRETEGLLEWAIDQRRWHAMLRHARRFREGDRLELIPPPEALSGGMDNGEASAFLRVAARTETGVIVEFEGDKPASSIIERFGWTPLPPYILKARDSQQVRELDRYDREHYQTVYAEGDDHPSIAAPTAGLHFTPELLGTIAAKSIPRLEVVLQVGAATFKPVETGFLEEHRMHAEWYQVPASTLAELARIEPMRRSGAARVIAVGTTSVRVLESLPEVLPAEPDPIVGETRLMIVPGTPIRRVDALLTNFHLPRSTLVALVAAFVGLDRLKSLYALAQREGYRFYSYGDAMLIL